MDNIFVNIILVISALSLVYYLGTLSRSEAVYVKSNLNNREYLVQNLENKEEATYMLSVVHQRIFILKDFLKENMDKYPEYKQYISQFCDRIKNLKLNENAPDGNYTSYTVNKGDEIALCLRSKKTHDFHDINLIMYVVLHELSHVACPELNHTDLFKKIFIFFLETAVDLKIYQKFDYQSNPQEYCGLIISENLLKNSKLH
jgi:hypothetical protein